MARKRSENGNGHNSNLNSWLELKELFRDTMRRHEIILKETGMELKEVKIEVAKLNIKAGLFGIVAGTLPLILTYLYQVFAK